jgi:hypothetical protein
VLRGVDLLDFYVSPPVVVMDFSSGSANMKVKVIVRRDAAFSGDVDGGSRPCKRTAFDRTQESVAIMAPERALCARSFEGQRRREQ